MKNPEQKNDSNNIKLTLQEPKRNFIIIYDSVYKNNDLTIEEIGFLIKLISTAPTFRKTKENFKKVFKITEYQYNKIVKGLKDKGYLQIKKFGKSSEWIITQEPHINKIKDFNQESLLNALINYIIDIKDLERLHKLKYIDDKLYIDVSEKYAKEIIRIAHINAYE